MTDGQIMLTVSIGLSCHSNYQMRVEWALESNANPTTIISLSHKLDLFSMHGKVRPGNAYPVTVINLLAALERRPEPTQVVKPLELL